MTSTYKCGRSFKSDSTVGREWIGRHYTTKIGHKPKLKLRDMIAYVQHKFRCEVSMGQCRMGKKVGKELIEGKLTEHYARIWDYTDELVRSNTCFTCNVGVITNPVEKNYF